MVTDRAVQFGNSVDRGYGPNKAFPFFYSFVSKQNDGWDLVKGAGTAANLTGIGPTVAAASTAQHTIVLSPDYPFKLLWIKYTAYYHNAVRSEYEWYDRITGWRLDYGDYQLAVGTPLHRYLRVSLSYQPDSKYAYGGTRTNSLSTTALTPIPLQVLQGYDYGIGQVRNPHLLPTRGHLIFEFTNNHPTKALVVGGTVFGMKVRV